MNRQFESTIEKPDVLTKARQWQEDIKERARNATHATTHYVEENPWKTIAIVAVCALALGFLLRAKTE